MRDPHKLDMQARIASIGAGVVAGGIGCYHLMAWLSGSMTYRGLTQITMKTNAALCLLLAAVSLVVMATGPATDVRRRVSQVLAVAVMTVGFLTLLQQIFGIDFGIDQLLAQEPPGAMGVLYPNRMGPPGAFTYTIGGAALLLLLDGRGRAVGIAQWLAVLLSLVATMGMLGYLYGVKELYGAAHYTTIALPATIGNFFLGLGLLFSRPGEGPMARVISADPGGTAMRRLLPAALILPPIIGWLRLQGEWHGLYERYYGTSIMVLSWMIIFSILIYQTGRFISTSSAAERTAVAEAQTQRQLFDAVFANMPAGVFLARAEDLRIVLVNEQYKELAPGKDMLGKTIEEVWPEIQPWFGDIQRTVASTGIPYHAVDDRILLTRSHGAPLEERYFSWSTVRVPLPDKLGCGVLTTAWETTGRKRNEEELEKARDLLTGVMEGSASNIAALDTKLRFLALNGAYRQIFTELFGVDAKVGDNIEQLLAHLPEQQALAMAVWQKALQGETVVVEEEFGLPGRRRHFEIRLSPIRDRQGTIVGAAQISSDISARKEAEDAVRQNEKKFRAVFEQAAVGIARVSFTDARWIDVNEAFFLMLGYTVEEMLATPWPAITHPDDVDLDLIPFRRMAAGELENYSVEKRFIHKNGRYVWARLTLSLVRDAAGKPDYEIAIIEDISDRKRAERELRESEQLLNTVLDNLPVGLWIIDRQGRLIRGNEKAKEIWRGARYVGVEDFGEYKGWRLDTGERIPAEEWGGVKAITRGETTLEQEVEIECFDGSHKIVLDSAVPITNERGEITGAVTVNQDISLRKQAEAALRESESRFRGIFENAAVGISLFDHAGRLMEANAKLYETLGYLESELRGRTFEDFSHAEDMEPDLSNYRQMMGGKLPYYTVEKRYARKDGIHIWVRVTRAVQRGPAEAPQYSINIVEDISARKQAEDALRRTATLLHAVTDNTPDVIYVKDREARILMANPAMLEYLEKTQEQVVGKTEVEFLGGEGGQRIMENDRLVLERGETLVVEEVPRPQGDRRIYLSSKSPYYDENGNVIGLIGIARDITDMKRAGEERERLLAEVQRSNQDLQQFAYVASHDLQEPLRMVSSYMQLLERRYKGQLDEKAKTYIDYAVDGTKRMQNLIDGLLRYSRISRDKELLPVDTNAAYAAAIANLAEAVVEAGGEVTADQLPTVWGDEIQLVQLFQNLIGNGLKYRKPGSAPKVHVSARQQGGEWVFSVTDNGIGIPPQHFDKVFQIFQRLHTNEEYPGTGIGLASCKKIVERHGGRIWVESTPGKGSTFYFALAAKE